MRRGTMGMEQCATCGHMGTTHTADGCLAHVVRRGNYQQCSCREFTTVAVAEGAPVDPTRIGVDDAAAN